MEFPSSVRPAQLSDDDLILVPVLRGFRLTQWFTSHAMLPTKVVGRIIAQASCIPTKPQNPRGTLNTLSKSLAQHHVDNLRPTLFQGSYSVTLCYTRREHCQIKQVMENRFDSRNR